MLEHVFFLEQLYPGAQERTLCLSLGKSLNRRSAGEQLMSILRNAEKRIESLIVLDTGKLQGA